MLKFIRGKGHHLSAERIKTQRELFAFHKTITHGFPTKPSALAYDPHLSLLAIGTKSGALKVVGKPGVEFCGQHPSDEASVLKIIFISKQGRLVTLCDDNSVHLWQIQNSAASLEIVKSQMLEGKLKKISCLSLRGDEGCIYVGTEGGNVYSLDANKFEITDKTIYMDVVLQNGPENYKVNPGAIEAVLEHPEDPTKVLIGYERGLIVMWDLTEQKTVKHYLYSQQLEDLSWLRMPVDKDKGDSLYFVSGHNDGSYVIWDVNKAEKPFKDATTPYGPYPCKKISKLQLFQEERGEPGGFLMVFAGGMPRAAYGDHYTVTVLRDGPDANGNAEGDEGGSPHVVFDLSSRVIDFAVIPGEEEEGSTPAALVILAEEEMVVVDLGREGWPVFHPHPYLNCLHPSALTAFHHVSAPSQEVYDALRRIGREAWEADKISTNAWPIVGGETTERKKERELLITGHEDGSVRFWDSTGTCLTLIATFSSSVLFSSDEMTGDHPRDDDDDEWPPFRKVGTFDPYSDDPRLAVKKIAFCPKSGVLSVGGTAGQVVVVTTLHKSDEQVKLEVDSCNLVADKDGFAWKGHEALDFKPKNNPTEQSLTVTALLQIQPPAAVTALALEAPSGVVAVGTAHGVLLYDFFRRKVVMTKSTLNPNDIMAAGDTPISRRKSIKKSLRESFRRLRKGRSQRAPAHSPPLKSPSTGMIPSPSGVGDAKPMERAIEARSTDDAMSSMVRTVSFAKTYIVSLQSTTGTLWAGTNSGAVYVFTVSVPGGERRGKEEVNCVIAKEIQLKHRAPVLSVIVLDCNTSPVEGFSPQHDHLGPHKVLIGSEEQIKIFTLPSLRPFGKLKLTAHEGSRVRRIQVATFVSTADSAYSEKCLVALTNQGDLYVITVPELRKQLMAQCLRREDISGISSLVFNERGEALHMCSSSELQRLSLSAKAVTRPLCSIPIAQPTVSSEFGEREIRAGPSPTPALENARNETKVEEVAGDTADITIDSVRDHTTLNTSVVEERLIDGPIVSSSSTVTSSRAGSGPNQIKSVTTVTTSISVQNSGGSEEGGVVVGTGVTLPRAPLAPVDETEIN